MKIKCFTRVFPFVFFVFICWMINKEVWGLDLSAEGPIETNIATELQDGEKALVEDKGELLVKPFPLSGRPLPQYRLYRLLKNISPEEAAAIFADFAYQKKYVPNMIKAEENKVETVNSIWMNYEMESPWPVPNARYITRNVIRSDGKGNYQVYWNQIESNLTKDTEGLVRFLVHPQGTFFIYHSRVEPSTLQVVVKLLKDRFARDVTTTVKAITDELLRVKGQEKDLLNKQVTRLRTILSKTK